MEKTEKKALSNIRLQHAEECLEDSRNCLSSERYKNSANRSYYAIFHAMRAVLALDEYDSKKHSGIISEFRKRYIKTEILPRQLSSTIIELFDIRTSSDYDDFFIISKEEVIKQYENAAEFVEAIKKYLNDINMTE